MSVQPMTVNISFCFVTRDIFTLFVRSINCLMGHLQTRSHVCFSLFRLSYILYIHVNSWFYGLFCVKDRTSRTKARLWQHLTFLVLLLNNYYTNNGSNVYKRSKDVYKYHTLYD